MWKRVYKGVARMILAAKALWILVCALLGLWVLKNNPFKEQPRYLSRSAYAVSLALFMSCFMIGALFFIGK